MKDNKSYVGMERCFICREEIIAILLDRRLKNTLTQHEVGLEVCDKCKEKYLKEGILLIEAEKQIVGKIRQREIVVPNGNLAVIKESSKLGQKVIKDFPNVKELRKVYVEVGFLKKVCG